jgi:ABC-type antimicrobial peptide transport system permease subunit
MVLRQTLVRASMGLLAGLILSAAVTRLLATMIHGVTPLDPITYLSVAVLLLAVVLAASYFPARRASKTDPLSALRDA